MPESTFIPLNIERNSQLLTHHSEWNSFILNMSTLTWVPDTIESSNSPLEGLFNYHTVTLDSPQNYIWYPKNINRLNKTQRNDKVATSSFSIGLNKIYNWLPNTVKFISQDNSTNRFNLITQNVKIPLVFTATDYDTNNFLHYYLSLKHADGTKKNYDSNEIRENFSYYDQSTNHSYTTNFSSAANFIQEDANITEFVANNICLKSAIRVIDDQISAITPLTSNTNPNPFIVSASSGTSAAWQAFNDNLMDAWISTSKPSSTAPQWLKVFIEDVKKITRYSISCPDLINSAKSWVIQGSNDAIQWHYVDYRVNQAPIVSTTYICSQPENYKYYRLLISEINGSDADHVAINQFKLFFENTILEYPQDIASYIKTTQYSNFTLNNMDYYNINIIYSQPLNTEIKSLVSFDQGNTWNYYYNNEEWRTITNNTLTNTIAIKGMSIESLQNAINNYSPANVQTLDFVFSLSSASGLTTPSISKIDINFNTSEGWVPFKTIGAPQNKNIKFQPSKPLFEGLWDWKVKATDGALLSSNSFFNKPPKIINRNFVSNTNENVSIVSTIVNEATLTWSPQIVNRQSIADINENINIVSTFINNETLTWLPQTIERNHQINNSSSIIKTLILRNAVLIDNCDSIDNLTEVENETIASFTVNTDATFYKENASWLISFPTNYKTKYVFNKNISSVDWSSYQDIQCWIYSTKYGVDVSLYINGLEVTNNMLYQGWQMVTFNISETTKTDVTSFGFGIMPELAATPIQQVYFDSIYGII